MTMGLTARQAELLAFIQERATAGELAPTLEEACVRMGLASRGRVSVLLNALEERGHIRRLSKRPRAIELVEQHCCPNCGHPLQKKIAA